MPDELTPPDVDTSSTQSAPVTPGATPVAPAYNQPSVGTRILGVLSGGLHNSSYQVDPTTGKMQTVTDPNVRKPGDMFRSMLQGMLTGLAGGSQPGVHGGLASFAGGAQASMAQQQQQDQQKRQQAQQAFENGQQAQTSNTKQQEFRASMIKSHDEHLASTFDLARKGAEMTQQDAKDSEALKTTIQNTPGSKYLGFHKASLDDTIAALKDPTERAQMLSWKAKNEIGSHPMYEMDANGVPKLLGNEFYHMEPKYDDKPTEKPVSWNEEKVDSKTGKSSFITHEIPAGQITNAEARAINTKPLTGAVTPSEQAKMTSEEKIAADKLASEKQLKLSEFGQQRSLQAQRFADEEKLAKDKGEIVDPGNIEKLVDQFGTYHRDVKDFTRLDSASKGALGAALAQKYPGWNESSYQASQTALNAAAKGTGTYAPLQSNDQGIQHLAALHKLVSALPDTSNVQLINRTIQNLARQTGNSDISSLDTLAHAVAAETANARSKTGHATDSAIATAQKDLDLSKGTRALKSAIETLGTKIIPDSLESMAGELQRQVPGLADREYRPNVSKGAEQALQYFKQPNPFNYGKTPVPSAGTVKGGYSFVGGDPSKKENWKPVNQ